LPVPRTVGKTIIRYSSTRSFSASVATSWALPLTRMSPSNFSLRPATSSATLSLITVELFHSGSSMLLETTYFGMLLNLSANSPSREGQASAKPSKVTRPSRRASLAITSSSLNWSPSSPRSNLKAQPPRSQSSEPPGSSITPSTETNCDTTTLPMIASFLLVENAVLDVGHGRGLEHAVDLQRRRVVAELLEQAGAAAEEHRSDVDHHLVH
jgi:hypothetical protein